MRLFWSGLIAVASLAGRPDAQAQLPQATLTWIYPPGARAGSTNEITVSGADLDEPGGLLFSDPRLTAVVKPGSANQFQVVVPDEVAESVMDVRLVGRFGVSNPRAFAVGKRPELIAPGDSASSTNAFELPLETTVNGRVAANRVSTFRFAARAAQRLFIRVAARELDSRLVPNLIVTDAAGRELAVARRREWLDFTAPGDGHYFLKLNDQTFRGGDDYHFRLVVTGGPQLDFALPPLLRVGETNRVTIFGRNLPGGRSSPLFGIDGKPLEQLEIDISAPDTPNGTAPIEFFRKSAAASLAERSFAWRWSGGSFSSNPLLFLLTTNTVVMDDRNELPEIVPPCEFSGLFPQRGKLGGVTFRARKGEVFWLDLIAERLGFPTDPHAVVQRVRSTRGAQGETLYQDVIELADTEANFGDREFNTTTRDSAARFEAPRDGVYRLLVRDLFNLGDTRPRYPYILSVRRESPDFSLVVLPMPLPRVGDDRSVRVLPAALRRDETLALKVLAFRRDGFKGEIALGVSGPPEGISIAPTRISADQNFGTLVLTASANAVTWTNAVIVGTATIGTNTVERKCAFSSVLWPVADFNNENASARLNRDAVLSVISAESAPVTIAAQEGKPVETLAGATVAIPLSVIRRGEFQSAFNLRIAGHEAFDKVKEIAIPEKATNATAEINLAEAKLPVGTHTLWFRGTVAGKYRNNPEALTAAEAELEAANKLLATVSAADKSSAEERKKAAEAAKKAAEEKAKPRDVTTVVYSRPLIITVQPAVKSDDKK
jgi:hypothetical protein